MSVSFVLKLSPESLENPDLDLRYLLPDTIAGASHGRIRANGYDYDDGVGPALLLFLVAEDQTDLQTILGVLEAGPLLENDLRATPVAVKEESVCRLVHPPALVGTSFQLRR